MTTVVPGAGWAGAMLGLAGSIVLGVLGLRAQRHPDAVRHQQLQAAVVCTEPGALRDAAMAEMVQISILVEDQL